MEITLLLYLCLSHHEDYFLGAVARLPVKRSHGICSLLRATARGADGTCLQLPGGTNRRHCAGLRAAARPRLPASPRRAAPLVQKQEKRAAPCITQKITARIFG